MFRSLESGKAKERNPFYEEDFLKDDIWERRDVLGKMLDEGLRILMIIFFLLTI
jgi:hypothetical protein